ncbi:MAG: serine hydrolase domain-containing protein [Pirellulales bacterium]
MRGLTTLSKLGLAIALAAICTSSPAAPVPEGAIAAIDRIAAEEIDQKKVASYAVAVVKDGSLVLARGYGYSDLENDVPATAETVYRLGSITKQFTAMAIMLLDEDDKLSVDDELTRFLPDYPTQGHKVTVRHLLNHTSGIKSFTSLPSFHKHARLDMSHDEMLALFKDESFDFEPGAKWGYSNSGYYLLGMIIEKASGKSYAEYLQEQIFRPLGMSATRYGDTQPLIRHRAMGYRLMNGELVNDESISMTAPFAAGALVSNVLDMVKWHQALEGDSLLSSASYEAMYQKTKLTNGVPRPYGYGWQLGELAGHLRQGHGGGIQGFSTMIGRYPKDRLCVIVLSNTATANSGAVESRIAKLLLAVEEKPVADLPIDAELASQLTGKYRLEVLELEILAEDGKLYVKLKGQPRDRLKYQGQRQFVSSENSELRMTFTPADGKAERIEGETEGEKLSATRAE